MKILVINGPNLNMLGVRDPKHYGSLCLKEINKMMCKEAKGRAKLKFFQSNYEGKIVEKIQKSLHYDAIIINPAAYTHTSVAIRDALELFGGPIVEVHLSKVDERDDFRQINYIRDLVQASFSGKKADSYREALQFLLK